MATSKIYGKSNMQGGPTGRARVPKPMMDQTMGSGAEGSGPYRTKVGETLDDAGFQTSGYIDKKGVTAEHAMDPDYRFNRMPPGMFIDDQAGADIRPMALKKVVDLDYPGDGWMGTSDDMGV